MIFSSDNEKGALFVEGAIVLPMIMILMMIFMYMVNIFVVQTYIQYALNQTVSELGNYTEYLNYLGIIDISNDINSNLKKASITSQDNIKKVSDTFNGIVGMFNENDNLENSEASTPINWNTLFSSSGTVQEFYSMATEYKNKPFSLLVQLISGPGISLADGVHQYLGAALGKMMMFKYADNDMIKNLGVVSCDYNGYSSAGYLEGIDGLDFSGSSFLGNEDSRIIDIIVVYRIKFPVNIARFAGADEGSKLYNNSLCVVQRATGYGWINGDGKAKGSYNGKDKKGLMNSLIN